MENEGYCERCGSSQPAVGLCGKCRHVENLIATIQERKAEIERLEERLRDVKELVGAFFLPDVDADEKKDATIALCEWCLEDIVPTEKEGT